jgi:hypothetical protein
MLEGNGFKGQMAASLVFIQQDLHQVVFAY